MDRHNWFGSTILKLNFLSLGLPFKNLIAKDIMLPSENEKKMM